MRRLPPSFLPLGLERVAAALRLAWCVKFLQFVGRRIVQENIIEIYASTEGYAMREGGGKCHIQASISTTMHDESFSKNEMYIRVSVNMPHTQILRVKKAEGKYGKTA